MNRQQGFTMVELMMVVAVVAILAVVAMPSYNDYVKRGKIPEATSNLASVRVQMEQFFQDYRAYNAASNPCTSLPTSSYFTFSCPAATLTSTTYTVQAAGTGTMAGFTYTIDQSNAKTTTITGVSGWTGSATCWITGPGGAC